MSRIDIRGLTMGKHTGSTLNTARMARTGEVTELTTIDHDAFKDALMLSTTHFFNFLSPQELASALATVWSFTEEHTSDELHDHILHDIQLEGDRDVAFRSLVGLLGWYVEEVASPRDDVVRLLKGLTDRAEEKAG